MAYTPYQPYSGYAYQQYIPQRFDNPPQMQNPAGAQFTGNPAQPGFICRPVTSREEAVAVPTDYFSPGTIMPDLGHGTIYLKRFNQNTGASDFFEFAVVQPQNGDAAQERPAMSMPDYSETFRSFGEQLTSVSERIDDLTNKIDTWKSRSKKGVEE